MDNDEWWGDSKANREDQGAHNIAGERMQNIFSDHAVFEMERRQIDMTEVEHIIRHPGQTIAGKKTELLYRACIMIESTISRCW